jgi:hypothetical protein
MGFPKVNVRKFINGTWNQVNTTESITVPSSAPYVVQLLEIPDDGTYHTAPFISTLTETTTYPPISATFFVNYSTGEIEFHIHQSGLTLSINYWKKGSVVDADDINWLYTEVITKPSPVITIDGDISGSGTMTELGDVTITTSIDNNVVTEDNISLSHVSTLNVSTAKHGLCPILPNDNTMFLNGQGIFTTVSSGAAAGFIAQAFFEDTSVDVTHNLGGYPIVQVLDEYKEVIPPTSITHNSVNDFTVTFSPSASGTILASVGSPGIPPISSHATDHTLTANDRVVVATAPITFTLPLASTCAGRPYYIKRNTSAGNVIITTTGSDKIDGKDDITMIANYSSVQLVSDGTGWLIL